MFLVQKMVTIISLKKWDPGPPPLIEESFLKNVFFGTSLIYWIFEVTLGNPSKTN